MRVNRILAKTITKSSVSETSSTSGVKISVNALF